MIDKKQKILINFWSCYIIFYFLFFQLWLFNLNMLGPILIDLIIIERFLFFLTSHYKIFHAWFFLNDVLIWLFMSDWFLFLYNEAILAFIWVLRWLIRSLFYLRNTCLHHLDQFWVQISTIIMLSYWALPWSLSLFKDYMLDWTVQIKFLLRF